MIAFISGKITDEPNYKEKFDKAQRMLEDNGYVVLNPTKVVPVDIPYDKQMEICYNLIKIADVVYFLENWSNSAGATNELLFAIKNEKKIYIQGSKQWVVL